MKVLFTLLITRSASAGQRDYPDQRVSDGSVCGGHAVSVSPSGYEPTPEYGNEQQVNLNAPFSNTTSVQNFEKSDYQIMAQTLDATAPHYSSHCDFLLHYDYIDKDSSHEDLTRSSSKRECVFHFSL